MYNRAIDISLLLLRIGFGGLMIANHGWPKFMRFFNGDPSSFGDPIGLGPEISLGLAVFAELFCAIMVVFGFFTRAALVPLMITMLVAFIMVKGGDLFGEGELPLVFFIPYLALFIAGPGWYSIDGRFRNKI
ncbi:MAG: DoxX family protein [Saprospiraceae bacterium]|nr:DoxX family protein [Saprospiraceae bacterium]